MVLRCGMCRHEAQDQMYGDNYRVCNPTKDLTRARCTVCKTLVNIPARKEEKK